MSRDLSFSSLAILFAFSIGYGQPPGYTLEPDYVESEVEAVAISYVYQYWRCYKYYWYELSADTNHYQDYFNCGAQHSERQDHRLCDWRFDPESEWHQYRGMPYAYCKHHTWQEFFDCLRERPRHGMPGWHGRCCHYTNCDCPDWAAGIDCIGFVSKCLWRDWEFWTTDAAWDSLQNRHLFYRRMQDAVLGDVLVSASRDHSRLLKDVYLRPGTQIWIADYYESASDSLVRTENHCRRRNETCLRLREQGYKAGSFFWYHVNEYP